MSDDKNDSNDGLIEKTSNEVKSSSSQDESVDYCEDTVDSTEGNDSIASSASTPPLFNAKPAPRMQTKKSAKSFSILTIIAIILLIILLSLAGWLAYNQYNQQKDWRNFKENIQQKLVRQNQLINKTQQIAESSEQLVKINQDKTNQQMTQYQQLNESLLATQQKVRQLSGRQKQDWMLAETEYLIQLAELKVTLEQDKLSALTLLKTADEKTVTIADNSLVELRQAIANDVAQLELIKPIDITGIASQLNAISQQIPQLKLITLEIDLTKNSQDTLADEGTFSWNNVYQNFLNDFIVIKDHDEPVKPLITPNERANLNANVQLALQQAQIALLKQEQTLYQMSLVRATEWITEYFKKDNSQTSMLEQLNRLAETQILNEFPKALTSKKTIQQINQSKLYQWLDNKNIEPVNSEQPGSKKPNSKKPNSEKPNSKQSSLEQSGSEKLSSEQSSPERLNNNEEPLAEETIE